MTRGLAQITFKGEPGTEIMIDGKHSVRIGNNGYINVYIEPGKHEIKYKNILKEVELNPGEKMVIDTGGRVQTIETTTSKQKQETTETKPGTTTKKVASEATTGTEGEASQPGVGQETSQTTQDEGMGDITIAAGILILIIVVAGIMLARRR